MAKDVAVAFVRDGRWVDYAELRVRPRFNLLMTVESEITQVTGYLYVSKSPSGNAIWLQPTQPGTIDEAALRDILNQFGYVMGWHVNVTDVTGATIHRQSAPAVRSYTSAPAPSTTPAKPVAAPKSSRVTPPVATRPAARSKARKLHEVVVDRVRDHRGGFSLVVASRGSMRQEDVRAASAALAEIGAGLQATRSPSGAMMIEAVDRALQRDGNALNNALKELANRFNWAVSDGSLQAWS